MSTKSGEDSRPTAALRLLLYGGLSQSLGVSVSTGGMIVWAIVVMLFLANVVVSVLVIRSRYYLWPQKLGQCAIVWAIPLLGPTAMWAFLRSQEHADIFDTRAYPEPTKKGIAVEVQNAIHDSVGDGGGRGGPGGVGD